MHYYQRETSNPELPACRSCVQLSSEKPCHASTQVPHDACTNAVYLPTLIPSLIPTPARETIKTANPKRSDMSNLQCSPKASYTNRFPNPCTNTMQCNSSPNTSSQNTPLHTLLMPPSTKANQPLISFLISLATHPRPLVCMLASQPLTDILLLFGNFVSCLSSFFFERR